MQRSVLELCAITSNSTGSIAVYAAATLSIGAKMAKRGSLLAAGVFLGPRQRGDRRFAGTGASGQVLQDPRIQRQRRRLFNLPLQPVLIHHLPQPGYGEEKSAFAQCTSTSASATPPWRPPQETGGSDRSTCSDTASTAETSASSAMLSRAAASAASLASVPSSGNATLRSCLSTCSSVPMPAAMQ